MMGKGGTEESEQARVNELTELIEVAKELRVAVACCMRVLADLDAMKLCGAERDTLQQRFVDEMKVSGVGDGIGVRAQEAIERALRADRVGGVAHP